MKAGLENRDRYQDISLEAAKRDTRAAVMGELPVHSSFRRCTEAFAC